MYNFYNSVNNTKVLFRLLVMLKMFVSVTERGWRKVSMIKAQHSKRYNNHYTGKIFLKKSLENSYLLIEI